jgi:c-di-GMP-binding flagellar brake protein YcgR
METLKIGINRIISIFWEDKKVYKATVQDEDKETFSITIPVAEGNYLFIKEGEWISATFHEENGIVYKFTTMIIKRKIENNIPMYVLTIPEKYTKVQRRNYVRVTTMYPIEYSIFTVDTQTVFSNFKTAMLLDLSGGGLRFKSKEKIELSEKVALKLKYEEEEVLIRGKVVRVDKTEDSEYIYGVSFSNPSERERDKIIKIVFTIIRRQRSVI